MPSTTTPFSLVLGAGGTVGLAYHAGVLKALADVRGIEAADADLIIGTSAGSVAGAYLRSGYTADDLWQIALGTHPSLEGIDEEEIARRRRGLFTPAWGNPVDLVRRGVGSGYALLQTVSNAAPRFPRAVRQQFPVGLFTMASGKDQLETELPSEWPERPLWLCAFDLLRHQRVVLGKDGSSDLPLPRGVMASCAIPGLYRAVRSGRRLLVDGGVASTTNLDLVEERAPELVIAVAPMAYDTADGPSATERLARRRAAVAVAREAHAVRAAGHDLVLIRPGRAQIERHGRNLMRADAGEEVARMAYESTCAALTRPRMPHTIVTAA